MCSICIVPLWRRRSPPTQASGASEFGGRAGRLLARLTAAQLRGECLPTATRPGVVGYQGRPRAAARMRICRANDRSDDACGPPGRCDRQQLVTLRTSTACETTVTLCVESGPLDVAGRRVQRLSGQGRGHDTARAQPHRDVASRRGPPGGAVHRAADGVKPRSGLNAGEAVGARWLGAAVDDGGTDTPVDLAAIDSSRSGAPRRPNVTSSRPELSHDLWSTGSAPPPR